MHKGKVNTGHAVRRRVSLSLVIWLSVSTLVVACITPGYFIPPTAPPTPGSDLAFLFETPVPGEATATAQVEELPPPGGTGGGGDSASADASPTPVIVNTSPILYYTQAADTLPVVAVRFGVAPHEITSPDPIPETDLLPPNQLLIIPRRLANTLASQRVLPDSELVYSPSATDFDIEIFVQEAGGYLSTYTEWLNSTGTTTGAQVVQRVALENSINPRLLLALLEYHSGWVYGRPGNLAEVDYPMSKIDLKYKGLYRQLVWTVNQLSVGYYAWREGRLMELRFADGVSARLASDLNAGSVALQYYFAQRYSGSEWVAALDLETGFPALYERMYGNPWIRAQAVEPLYPPGITQPNLILPFQVNRLWAYTGGPHGAWEHDGSYAALDFAPGSMEGGCVDSDAWVVASADGLVVRSGGGVVVLDLDGDGYEGTGWVLLYLHVSNESSVPVGTWVGTGEPLGHPSCEGGMATGTHVHMARKYNGEWIAADGPMPFELSGWRAHAGEEAYKGTLTRDGETIPACTCSSFETRIIRTE